MPNIRSEIWSRSLDKKFFLEDLMLKTDNGNAMGMIISKLFGFHFFFFSKISKLFNSLQPSVVFLIKTSYLICSAIQINDFYTKYNTRLKWGSPLTAKFSIMQKLGNTKYRKKTYIFDTNEKSTIKKVLLPHRISWFVTRTISADTAANENWQV